MIRVYLDWNVFSNFRKSNEEEFKFLHSFLINNRNKILVTYSSSHLSDLQRSYNKSQKGAEETWKDLELLNDITEGHCLAYDYRSKTLNPDVINPVDYFKEVFINNAQEDLLDFDSLFDESDEVGKILKEMWQTLMNMPSGINMDTIKNIPEEYSLFENYFKKTKDNNTLGAVLEDIINLFKNPEEHSKVYKQVRNRSNKDLKINTGEKDWKDPIDYLNNHLKKISYGKSFVEIVDQSLSNMKKEPTAFDVFTSYYMQLDMFGYYKDKKLSNLIDDASHAFSGAHTDLFITEDVNTLKKANVLYKHFNISTEVVKSEDAVAFLRRKLLFEEEKPFIEQIAVLLKKSVILLDSFDDELNPARIYKVEPYLIGFFNRMQFSQYEEYNALIFYKRDKNYSRFIFWKELATVVDKISNELGLDQDRKGEFEEHEKGEINKKNWGGRSWIKGKSLITLSYEDRFGLTLVINL